MQSLRRLNSLLASEFSIRESAFTRLCLAYVFMQVALWLKLFLFIAWIGAPATDGYTRLYQYIVSEEGRQYVVHAMGSSLAFAIDVVFHQIVHVWGALCAFVLAVRAKHSGATSLLAIVFLATLVHNVGYWVTGVFSSGSDIVIDFVANALEFILFFLLVRTIVRVMPGVRSVRVPLIE